MRNLLLRLRLFFQGMLLADCYRVRILSKIKVLAYRSFKCLGFSMARVVHTIIKELVEAGGATDEEDKEDDQSKEDNVSRIQNKKKAKKTT